MNIGDKIEDMVIVDKYSHNRRMYALVKCEVCGRTKHITMSNLNNHHGTEHASCGHGLRKQCQRFYTIWKGMRARTTNPNTPQYCDYGGRGISSEAFANFIDFYDQMYYQYEQAAMQYGEHNISLDRIDVDGDYEPSNCRFATAFVQQGNTRKNREFYAFNHATGATYEGKSQAEFARQCGLSLQKVFRMLHEGAYIDDWSATFVDFDEYDDYPVEV